MNKLQKWFYTRGGLVNTRSCDRQIAWAKWDDAEQIAQQCEKQRQTIDYLLDVLMVVRTLLAADPSTKMIAETLTQIIGSERRKNTGGDDD